MDETTKILFTSGLAFFTSIVAAYITTIITVQLSLRRFRSEHWWERKAEVYGGLLDALYDLQQHAASIIREQEPSDEERREFETRSKKARAEIQKFQTIGAFIISDKVWNLVDDMQKERDNNIYQRAQDFYDMVDEDELILSRYISKFREQIRKDLKITD